MVWKEMPPVTDVVPEEATWLSVAQHDQSFLASEALTEALATAHYARLYDVTLSTHSESVPDYDPAEPMEDCPSPARTQTRFEGWIPCAHLRAEKRHSLLSLGVPDSVSDMPVTQSRY